MKDAIPRKAIVGRTGGKSNLANRLIDMFPRDYQDMIYVEPFVGGGSIFFRKLPSKKDIINDKDSDIYTIYKEVKRRDINNDIKRTKITKKYFNEVLKGSKDPVKIIERHKSSFFANGKTYNDKGHPIKTNFTPFHERLKDVTIYNKDFKALLKQYDSPNTFFYLDPPYSVEDIKDNPYKDYVTPTDVYNAVKGLKGKWMISYNNTPEIRDLFSAFHQRKLKTTYSGTKHIEPRTIVELVITNYTTK
jgi:DNA adenine methylase